MSEPREVRELAGKAKTQQERAAERRQAKLEEIQQQIDEGTLTVRQMTPAERKRNPPRPRKGKK
jgi:anti-sigma28 factor (negative regulator of flagellin synthesis)